MFRRTLFGLAILALAAAPPAVAAAIAPGASMFALQVSNGIADFADQFSPGYIGAYDHSEWGVRGEFWKMMGEDYAWNISGGASWFSETNKPGDAAPVDSPEIKYSQKSWHVRIGGDRVVNIGERGAIYFGPGIEYWTGSAKFEVGDSSSETPDTKRFSFYGRLGGLMTIGSSWGLTGHIGHTIGYAKADEAGAEATWWPSGFDASGGLAFTFGGSHE